MDIRFPAPLRPGSVVAVVAPAGPFPREELLRGMAWLRTRYVLRVRADLVDARDGFLAGDDARRGTELARALADPSVEAVFAARGGYGAMRILGAVDWPAFAARPKWIVGFSDVTALHLACIAAGVASVHAPNVTGLGRRPLPRERAALLGALERPQAPTSMRGLCVLHDGSPARGPVVGGNLTLVASMAAAGRLVVPEGAILALEDVTEKPYRIDRMLTALDLGGHLARASGVVFGGFTDCSPGSDGITALDVLRERTRHLRIRVAAGAPFGHETPNDAFVHGRVASLTGDALSFE